MIRITDQYFWNVVFSVFFIVMVALGAIVLETESRIAYSDLTGIDYLLLTLATFRLTRLFVYDAMTKFVREQFLDVKKARSGYTLEKPAFGPRRTLADLFGCPWCFAVWGGAVVIFCYLLTPYAQFPVLILAISGVATFVQLLANMVGHRAEQLKNQNSRDF